MLTFILFPIGEFELPIGTFKIINSVIIVNSFVDFVVVVVHVRCPFPFQLSG